MQDSHDVIEFLEETPAVCRKLAQGLADGDLRWKPAGDQFSFIENACHLRDIEVEGYGARIRKLMTEDGPQLPDVDGPRLARERDYNGQDFDAALDEFARARAENVRAIKNLSSEQLDRTGVLEGVGQITLGKLFLLMREHDESHRRELVELRERMAGERQ